MSFNGEEGAFITIQNAADLTANYRNANSSNSNLILGHFLGKQKLQEILNQQDCLGLRIYHGVNGSTGKPEIVVVGAGANEDDMLDLILDQSMPCPPNCGNENSLNS